MSHPFMPHGWEGANEFDKVVAEVAIGKLMGDILSDPLGPTKVIAEGPFVWRQRFTRAFRSFRLVDADAADPIFLLFETEHANRYPGETPSKVLDRWIERTPPTPAEIAAAWDIQSDSTEEARRYFYGDKHPQQVLAELLDEHAHDPITVH